MNKPHLAVLFSRCNLALSLGALAIGAGSYAFSLRESMDELLFASSWSYLVLTPVLTVLSLVMSQAGTRPLIVRLNKVLLAIWAVMLIAISTLVF